MLIPVQSASGALTLYSIMSDFSGTPGVDVPTDQFVNDGRTIALIRNDRVVSLYFRILATGKCSEGFLHHLGMTEVQSGKYGIFGVLDRYRYNLNGRVTIEWYDENQAPLPSGADVGIALIESVTIPSL